ncbi:ABC transporter substrate-binding protein [Calidifontibacter sp. DB0510]|uniref:ABC transporter substrate-binding protein n=1 Tax=Metallococcus carri TaxID=1656884 RepID=A0A967B3R8_9MICO|nr:ABC transporter substrate-binding protein [Metallococcus carri]NHN56725.1 ABC transporter substrate-binding protein [Metallococcus carri]NOP37898.1 ABC transporter substrate-binding protein [Calidifontibacter sp. DB2511S]
MKRMICLSLTAATALGLTACGGGSNPMSSGSGGGGNSSAAAGTLKVGAADFPESQLLAAIYAGALNAKGVKASTGDPIGAREVYLKALNDGSVDVVPEYAYSLLTFYDKSATQKDAQSVATALKAKLPAKLQILNPAQAQDANSVAVTKETATKWNLKTIADLAKQSDKVIFGAPPEFQKREQGLPGLKSAYNLAPKTFRPLKGNALVQALKNGQVNAANIFTTDPSIKSDGFVVLEDPKHVFGSDNVVPLITKAKATPQVQQVLNSVQGKLTTDNLAEMVKQVVVDKKDAGQVATTFLKDNGLA